MPSTSRAPTTRPTGSAFSPGERYGRVYQINYLRCILCGLCIEACPTRALTMTNEYELADSSRESLIYEKQDLLAPLLPGMEAAAAPDAARRRREAPTTSGPASSASRPPDGRGRCRHDRLLGAGPDHGAGRARHGRWSATPCTRRMLLAVVMVSLAIMYAVLDAPFLFAVQIIVYTGAVLMLFLFVLMLVGVDSADSLVETIPGQRAARRRLRRCSSPSC